MSPSFITVVNPTVGPAHGWFKASATSRGVGEWSRRLTSCIFSINQSSTKSSRRSPMSWTMSFAASSFACATRSAGGSDFLAGSPLSAAMESLGFLFSPQPRARARNRKDTQYLRTRLIATPLDCPQGRRKNPCKTWGRGKLRVTTPPSHPSPPRSLHDDDDHTRDRRPHYSRYRPGQVQVRRLPLHRR